MRHPFAAVIYTPAFENGPAHPLRRIGKAIGKNFALVVLDNQRIKAASLGAAQANLNRIQRKGGMIGRHELLRSRRTGQRLGLVTGHTDKVPTLAVPVVEAVNVLELDGRHRRNRSVRVRVRV